MTFFHPATMYLIFHIFVVTLRLLAVSAGAPLMFDDQFFRSIGFSPVTLDELIRAALYADIALVVSTIGFIMASDVNQRHKRQTQRTKLDQQTLSINPSIYLPIIWITFLIGVIGLVFVSVLPGNEGRLLENVAIGEWASSSWVFITQTWVGVALVGFIYVYGFRRTLIVLMSLYFLLQLYQGFHRFRIVMPLILLVGIYLLQNSLKWPRRWMVAAGIIFVLLFLPAKQIGRMLQDGQSLSAIAETTVEILVNLPTRSTSDLVLLDQFAMGLSLVDNAGRLYYGTGYLPLITLPIPRPLWPEKPDIAFYMAEIQTADRPVAQMGMIVTYLGESYVNFGFFGIIVIPFLLSFFLGRLYFAVSDKPYNSISKLAYIITVSSLILVYRDGLTSLVLFTVVTYMPIAFIIILHVLFRSKNKSQKQIQEILSEGFIPQMRFNQELVTDHA